MLEQRWAKDKAILLLLGLWLLAFWPALISAAKVWHGSDIFHHCFFVLPIVLYIFYQNRSAIFATPTKANFWFLPPVMVVALVAVVGAAGSIQLLEHIAAFTILPLLLLAMLGVSWGRAFWFPLVFLLFAIPIGGELVLPLQKITAYIAIKLLSLTTIPFHTQGLYISIPEGRFVVAAPCSGIRFFIACIAYGFLYAYLSYRRPKLWFVFIASAIALPIIANGLRVFFTIVIGHMWGMDAATGTDHMVFGWGFFAVILFILTVFGEWMRRFQPAFDLKLEGGAAHPSWYTRDNWSMLWILSLILIMVYAATVQARKGVDNGAGRLDLALLNDTYGVAKMSDWQPSFTGATAVWYGRDSEKNADLMIAWYEADTDGSELVHSGNYLYRTNMWSEAKSKRFAVDNMGDVSMLRLVSGAGSSRIIIYWYELPGGVEAFSVVAKLKQSIDRVFGGAGAAAVVAVSLEADNGNAVESDEELASLVMSVRQTMRQALPYYKPANEVKHDGP